MRQRISASGADIWIAVKIPIGVKQWVRVVPPGRPVSQIMHQRVGAGGADVGIAIEIPVGIEEWIRITVLVCAILQIVIKWIDAGRPNVRILLKVPIAVEQAGGCDQFGICPIYAAFAKAGAELKPHRPPKLLDDLGGMQREARPCSDLSKRLAGSPAGAAAGCGKFFSLSCG